MSKRQIIFKDDKDIVDFADRFLTARMSSLNNDIKRCLIKDKNIESEIGQPAPFPALLYCFAIIDLLAALYAGNTDSTPGEKTKRSKRYMREFMNYKDHLINLLQGIFRHKLVHLSEPTYGFLYNGKWVGWVHDERPSSKHLDMKDDNHTHYDLHGKGVWHDMIFNVKITQFKNDIITSVIDKQKGFLAQIKADKETRENFKRAMYEILQ
jgi:hypothetical protein